VKAILLAFLLSGCGASLVVANTANEAAHSMTSAIMSTWDALCKKEAITCNVAGKVVLDDCKKAGGGEIDCKAKGLIVARACPKLATCEKSQDAYYEAVNTIHTGAADFAVLYSLDRKDTLGVVLASIKLALSRAYDLAQKAGVFSGGLKIGGVDFSALLKL
jgi:hypothetical protein